MPSFKLFKITQVFYFYSMRNISNQIFGGERPLFNSQNLYIENVTITEGESALKECSNIIAKNCVFQGKYPFWHVDYFKIQNCNFTKGARAALWYSNNLNMIDCKIDAPKMFRKMDKLNLRNLELSDAIETLWDCNNVFIDNCKFNNGDYLCLNSKNIVINSLSLNGNYSFQGCRNVTITNSILNTKDAFWEADNVTVINSSLNGEYLGWHSRNLHLINCKIKGTQPFCYTKGLTLENCEFDDDCDLAFEYAEDINCEIVNTITSVKNPSSGIIKAYSIKNLIKDEYCSKDNNCHIITLDGKYDL